MNGVPFTPKKTFNIAMLNLLAHLSAAMDKTVLEHLVHQNKTIELIQECLADDHSEVSVIILSMYLIYLIQNFLFNKSLRFMLLDPSVNTSCSRTDVEKLFSFNASFFQFNCASHSYQYYAQRSFGH